MLVSIRGPVLVRTVAGQCQAVALDAPVGGMQWLCPQPVRPRWRPPSISSALPEQSDAFATLFLQDVYNGLEPYVERGEVKRLRVVREMQKTVRIDPSLRAFGFQFPVISCGATYAGKEVLGEVPIEPDGSVSFRVPAGVPIYFMALDQQGRAVQRMRSFTHFMPGEVQGCVGCHEHRRQASRPNLAAAFSKPPLQLQPPEWGTGGFDYSRIVQPVLDKHCTECHNPVDAPKGIDLTGGKTDFFSVSYDVLARENQGPSGSPLVNWIPTYNGQEQNILKVDPKAWGSHQSVLAEVVLSGHPDEDGKPKVDLDEASRRRVLAWIDLNVPYYGSSETAYPEMTGCRRIYPQELDQVLAEVAARRCAACHTDGKIPRREWTRVTEPQWNPFLIAPLAQSAGGSQRCGEPVFQSQDDPDYQAILATFQPAEAMLAATPRMDMPGAKPSSEVSRSCQ
jgi:roadblock/LC7 domain-containing protein